MIVCITLTKQLNLNNISLCFLFNSFGLVKCLLLTSCKGHCVEWFNTQYNDHKTMFILKTDHCFMGASILGLAKSIYKNKPSMR